MSNSFIKGECIDLVAPEEDDFSVWSRWFNDSSITKFLDQGRFPNSQHNQRDFFLNAQRHGRFLTLIKTKNKKLLGVISLSEISDINKTCQISYVCPVKDDSARYGALEAVALATNHAFEILGMDRVWAGHVYPGLKEWTKKTEILGFFPESYSECSFRKGRENFDEIITSCTYDRFFAIKRANGGFFWPGEERVLSILEKLKSMDSVTDILRKNSKKIYADRLSFLLNNNDR